MAYLGIIVGIDEATGSELTILISGNQHFLLFQLISWYVRILPAMFVVTPGKYYITERARRR